MRPLPPSILTFKKNDMHCSISFFHSKVNNNTPIKFVINILVAILCVFLTLLIVVVVVGFDLERLASLLPHLAGFAVEQQS